MPASIHARFDSRFAYLYIWLSKAHQVAYVGQTNVAEGTLRRAVQHVTATGAFRLRFEEEVGLTLEQAEDLMLVSYPLPAKSEYTGVELSYREAVEYAVQRGLHDARINLAPRFKLISNVRYSERADLEEVRTCARHIVERFTAAYPQLTPKTE